MNVRNSRPAGDRQYVRDMQRMRDREGIAGQVRLSRLRDRRPPFQKAHPSRYSAPAILPGVPSANRIF
jgi:hypothetical protein